MAPGRLDGDRTFGSLRASLAAYASARTLPATPTLAVPAGATRGFGGYPFFESASLGGRRTLRGLGSRRYIGDAEVHGGAELRLDLGEFVAPLPGEWGVYGLGDLGRVFLEGESSRRWHTAAGAGIWFAFLERRSTMTVTWATSGERSRLYVQAGFHY